MIAVQTDFDARAEEVALYFQFLREFHEQRIAFLDSPTGGLAISRPEQVALFKTLKANGFLLLYNLVESTVKNAIEAIFDELKTHRVPFDACRDEIRHIVLTNLRRRNVKKLLPTLSAISFDVVDATFRKAELFSGNVDARRIRDVATEYGFLSPNLKSDELLTVKDVRNDLAHGDKSFADVGRGYDVERLEEIKSEVVTFLDELLNNVADYITTRSYLASPSQAPTTFATS